MTLRAIFIEEHGELAWKKLPRRLRGIFERIDAITANEKPLTRKQLADALS